MFPPKSPQAHPLETPLELGDPNNSRGHTTKRGFKDCPVSSIAPEGWGPKEGGNTTSPLHSRGSPNNGGQNQKSKRTPGVTMMHHATKRGFKDCPGFLNSTGRLGPKRGRKCYITPAFSGVPNKGGQNQNSKPTLRVTMMPLGAPSISKYGSLVRPDAQRVALRALRLRSPLRQGRACAKGRGAAAQKRINSPAPWQADRGSNP